MAEGEQRAKPVYCTVCSLPVEYCEFQPSFDKCKEALVRNWPTSFPDVTADEDITALMTKLGFVGEPDDAAKKARATKRADKDDTPSASAAAGAPAADDGGAGDGGGKKKKGGKADVAQVVISIVQRNRRKHITSVVGLDAHGVKLGDASKVFGKKFASGASVVKNNGTPDAVEIQGEFKEPLAELIADQFGVAKAAIFFLDGGKKEPMF